MLVPLAALVLHPYGGVVIRRDEWGVPHVSAPTDAGCVYGLMFAQAEDHFAQIERDVIRSIGREAELTGEAGLVNDVRVRAFRIVEEAQAAYRTSPPRLRALADAYAAGLNRYLETHPRATPRLIQHFEPWHFMADIDLPRMVDGVSTGERSRVTEPDTGSNAWALAPKRTEEGAAVLFINPHVGLFGSGLRYECHVESGQGWRFSGFCILGQPIPHSGHNGRLGWTHTNSGADRADAYRVQLVGSDAYRFGSEEKPIESWTIPIRVGDTTRPVTFRRTHHGPLVRAEVAVRFPVDRAVRQWQQKFAMGRAGSLAEFKRALAQGCLTYSNTTYADQAGNIAFWYGNTVPRRDPAFGWGRPADGSDPRTEWRGYLAPHELPHVINPASGFVQNANSDPWTTTPLGAPRPESYPSYVVRDTTTKRAENLLRILGLRPKFTFSQLTSLATDTYAFTAKERIPLLRDALGKRPDLRDRLSEPLRLLEAWDGKMTIHSIPATLYVLSEQEAGLERQRPGGSADDLLEGLAATLDRLERDWGSWRVPYGLVHRLQRRQPFDPDAPSLPTGGGPGALGPAFTLGGTQVGRQRFGAFGNSYVGLVQFGPRVHALSVNGFGQSGHPSSRHFFDQAPLYAAGKLKRAWFYPDEVRAHAARTYSP